jgi:DNA-binding Xre family transcriptional regulator
MELLSRVFSWYFLIGIKAKREIELVPAVRLRVREIAEEKGIGMNKLSRLADVNIKTIRRLYDDPQYSPTVNTLSKIARALGVHTSELIEDIPDTSQGDPQ